MNLVFLGPPGAGKGTQAAGIAQRYNLPHISTGEILRQHTRENTPLGQKAKGYMDAGQLVPDELVIGMLVQRIAQPDCAKGCLFDGFPRTLAQAETLAEEVKIDLVVDIQVPDHDIVQRLSGRRVCKECGGVYHVDLLDGKEVCAACGGALIQRDDDKEQTVINRLRVYHEQTAPLIEYYRTQGLLRNVEGTAGIDTVFVSICALIDEASA